MKSIPYIYILFFISFYYNGFSQKEKSLIIKGSDTKSDFIIRQIYSERVNINNTLLSDELSVFRNKLNSLGFLHHTLDTLYQKDNINYAYFSVQDNIEKIVLFHPEASELSKKFNYKQTDSNQFIVPIHEISYSLDQLINYYQNSGFPFVTIQLNNLTKEATLIYADLIIDKNSVRNINKVVIKGYTDFPKTFIRYKLNLKRGEKFNKNRITQISKNIKTITFASEIKKPELLFTKDSTALYLYLERKKSNYFDGLIGFSNSEDKKGLKLNGYLKLKLQNALNYGESLELNWHSNGNQQQSLNLSLNTPYILATPFTSKYVFNIHKQDTTYLSIKNNFNLNYRLTNNQRIGIILSHSNSNKITPQAESNIIDFTSLFYGISYHYTKPNNDLIFNKKIELISNLSQGKRNKSKQNKLSNYFSYLFSISENKNIIIKSTSELLLSDEYYENEVFRLGGSTSIRGFDENSIQSKGYSYLNLAYNYSINNSTYISILSDTGVLEEIYNNQLLSTYSFGIGYSAKTALGNLGIQYFIGNTNRNSFSFSNSKLHFSLSQNF